MGITAKGKEVGILAALDRLEAFANSPSGVLEDFALYAKDQHTKAMQNRFDPITGKPWAPLKPSTIAQRKVTKRPNQTILSTLYTEVRGNSMEIGYNSPIAAFQHFGVSVPARTIVPKNKKALYWVGAAHPVGRVNQPAFTVPARPRIGYSQADLQHLDKLIAQKIQAIWDGQ
jgi:hypothetical protein